MRRGTRRATQPWGVVAEAGERLEAAEGIDAHVRLAVAEWRKIEAAQTALAEEVCTQPDRIAAWRERRAGPGAGRARRARSEPSRAPRLARGRRRTGDHGPGVNQVERWFAELTRKQLQRGVHRSILQLEADIRAFIETHNENPRPFKWTRSADEILAAVKRFCLRVEQNLCHEL